MIDVQAITDLQRTTVRKWHQEEIDNPYEGFLGLVCEQHQRNYRLWHQEDIARSREAGDEEIAQVKRNIDDFNQQRNDHIEQLDDRLIEQLGAAKVVPQQAARLNTETPGSVIDRLSILALRLYHMEEQAARRDADEKLRQEMREKLEVLHVQHHDLSTSLAELLDDIFAGRKLLKVYRQFKMYNDPRLNPYLSAAAKNAAA